MPRRRTGVKRSGNIFPHRASFGSRQASTAVSDHNPIPGRKHVDRMKPSATNIPDPDFPQLMAQLRARLHRYCARMTGSVLDGEDVVQETLIKANDSYDAQAIQNVEGWLFRIAHNTAMDLLRRRWPASV
mgnify:CR=1 FL=1